MLSRSLFAEAIELRRRAGEVAIRRRVTRIILFSVIIAFLRLLGIGRRRRQPILLRGISATLIAIGGLLLGIGLQLVGIGRLLLGLLGIGGLRFGICTRRRVAIVRRGALPVAPADQPGQFGQRIVTAVRPEIIVSHRTGSDTGVVPRRAAMFARQPVPPHAAWGFIAFPLAPRRRATQAPTQALRPRLVLAPNA